MKYAFDDSVNLRPKTLQMIKAIDGIINEYVAQRLRLSVRQVYYQCVARDFCKNSQQEYKNIQGYIERGRLAGLLDWDALEDRTRFVRINSHWDSPKKILEAVAEQYQIDKRATQPIYIECWIEKDSLVSILETVCRPLDVPFFSCRGFPSITALYEATKRFYSKRNKQCVILYAGDHDPSGLMIPRVIEEKLNTTFGEDFGISVSLERIGLTWEQIKAVNPPPNVAKESDNNFKAYYAETGLKESWELDALRPDYLAGVFRDAIMRYTDTNKFEELQKIEQQQRQQLNRVASEQK